LPSSGDLINCFATAAGADGLPYCLAIRPFAAITIAVLVIAGCGASAVNHSTTTATSTTSAAAATVAPIPQAHPQVVEPSLGVVGASTTTTSTAPLQVTPPAPTNDPRPTAPASITNAPAKGAPTNAEVRAAIAQFKLAISQYHLDRLNFRGQLLNLSQLPPGPYNVSIASVFTAYGDPVACGGILHVSELGVANKTLPCGTEVIFVYNGRAIRVPVIDRGPYIAGRTWDLTGATAEALHFPGLGSIQWRLG
jgi:rare lipoprotein A (peptidoglycan hydrolase)